MTLRGRGRAGGRRWFALPLALMLLAAVAACTAQPSSPDAAAETPAPFADCASVLAPPSAPESATTSPAAPGSATPAIPTSPGTEPSSPGKEPGQGPFKTPPPVGRDAEVALPLGGSGAPGAVLTTSAAGKAPSAAPASAGAASAGAALPDVALPCFTGGAPVRLADVRGPAVINLWASWCEPCRTELPVIQDLADRAAGRVTVLGVDVGDSREAAASFAAGRDVSIPTLYDRDRQLLGALGRVTLPVTVFVDAAGRTYVHPVPVDARSLAELVRTHTGVAVAP